MDASLEWPSTAHAVEARLDRFLPIVVNGAAVQRRASLRAEAVMVGDQDQGDRNRGSAEVLI